MVSTRESLLERLKVENADEAWEEFFALYWRPILSYGRKLGLSAHEAEDVLQETMVALIRVLPGFVYDRSKGRFRNFLLTIVHRKAMRVFRVRRRRGDTHEAFDETRLAASGAVDLQAEPPGVETGEPDQEAQARWRESLGQAALERLKADPHVDERTLAVFLAYAVERRPAAEVARGFGLKENAVYQIKNRLLKRLQAEVRRMERDAGGE